MIWGGMGERRGDGGRQGQGQLRGTGTGIFAHKMFLLRFGVGRERKGGTEGDRDRDS